MKCEFGWLKNCGSWFEFNGEFIKWKATNDSGWYFIWWDIDPKYKVKYVVRALEVTDEKTKNDLIVKNNCQIRE